MSTHRRLAGEKQTRDHPLEMLVNVNVKVNEIVNVNNVNAKLKCRMIVGMKFNVNVSEK